ncbi:tripartite tricarboxylate transporter permease [Sediminibacillus albus]|uniref:Putative tricarboxylic transport membrane protein n=1 Tax=Sediminibacillus albus TaxID=407036 RepID=A0A1G8VU64_9BACI|nr:tripartite tricarboxylate transporter permease [Sediminibacillus albus]SDJ69377.1 putative tricarboxylic transport membrane protein [Sediminibacillus albus]
MGYIFEIFELRHLIFLICGLLTGIIVGALPGLTPTMGVALTIPFTFSLGPTEGLILLGGIYCGSVYGGSIPAILFNVPGAPASVATTFDGYPMAQNGQGRKALELTTIASVIGGLAGMFLLLFFAPIFADVSLQFGPAQSFWIAIFGITVIAAISEGSITKNLIGGCFGIGLSFVGIHTVTGTARFTFGVEGLVGGFHIVAVLIGLFAFPQALRLIELLPYKPSRPDAACNLKKSTIKESFKDILTKPKSVLIGSGLGSFIGMIPGAGGNIASILAYNEVKRFSKHKHSFGKGEKHGIIASESANNAMVGGSLIPLLTLGIPGSPTAAIFLGGLLIHGIWPGRNLFIDHADVAYTFLYSMVAAQVLLLFLGLALIKYVTKLSRIPSIMMAPIIVSFSIIGAYTTQNSVFDIYTVVIIGLLMFIMQKYAFSPAPVALGFILGGIAEEGLLLGMQVGAANGQTIGYFFSGAWNITLVVLIVATVSAAVFQGINHKRPLRKNATVGTAKRRIPAIIPWIVTSVLSVIAFSAISKLELELKILPQITLLLLLLLSLIEMVKNVRQTGIGKKASVISRRAVPLLILVVTVSMLIDIIGFYTQVIIFMLSIPLYAYWKNWYRSNPLWIGLVTVLFTLFLYLMFTVIFQVPFPSII